MSELPWWRGSVTPRSDRRLRRIVNNLLLAPWTLSNLRSVVLLTKGKRERLRVDEAACWSVTAQRWIKACTQWRK